MVQDKKCGACREVKPVSEFYKDAARKDGLLYRCKMCQKAKSGSTEVLEARRKHYRTPTGKNNHFRWHLKRYGISLDDWHQMLVAQSGRCAACSDPLSPETKHVHVDHCHDTDRVRGLLCAPCNRAEGFLRSDPGRALNLVAYLCSDRAVIGFDEHVTRLAEILKEHSIVPKND